jgi:hypothetical protein
MTFDPANSLAPYLQTSVFFPDEFDEFRVKFLALYRDISSNVNVRQIGVFDLEEFLTGERWPTIGDPQKKRQTFRIVIRLGALAAGTTNIIPHGITGIIEFTHIYGTGLTTTASGGGFRSVPLPYVNVTATANQIQIEADPTNVFVVLGAGGFSLSSGFIILEYLKNN